MIVYTTDWELHLLVINLKGSIYYFINNIWYKYTGMTKQKDKYLMADKKLRIQYTENWRLSNPFPNTTKTLDRHELRCSIWVCSSNVTNTTSWEKVISLRLGFRRNFLSVLHPNLVSSPIKGILEILNFTPQCIPMNIMAWTDCVRSSAGKIT